MKIEIMCFRRLFLPRWPLQKRSLQHSKGERIKNMLKLEVAIPAPSMDFEFNQSRPMPFLSAPSTPKGFGAFSLSAPTSPSRMAEFYRHFDDEVTNRCEQRSSGIPFNWEERPGTPKSPKAASKSFMEDDFAFDFSAEREKASLSADQLFDGGKIRPLKPPPGLQLDDSINRRSPPISPRSPRSPIEKGKKIISQVLSPRRKKLDSDPFATAAENTRKRAENERGRERTSSRRPTRSVSPFRVAQFPWEEEEEQEEEQQAQTAKLNQNTSISSNSSSSSSSTPKSSSKKWSLRDFLLFRSASEGRASDRDRFRKYYAALFRKHEEEVKNTSFRSADGDSGSVSGSRRKGRVSAHELHYKTNKAVSDDLKKKTFLPYKPGILGTFAFNPTVRAPR